MRDHQRRGDMLRGGEGAERYLHIAGAGDIELGERGRVLLILRHRFQNHAILVGLGIDGGNLPLAKGVVERVVDLLERDAKPARRFAVHLHHHPQAAVLRFGGDIAQCRISLQLLREPS